MSTKGQVTEKKGIGTRIKETFAELKKVHWPSFGKTLKNTGIVLSVVLFFTAVLMALGYGLEHLHRLLIGG